MNCTNCNDSMVEPEADGMYCNVCLPDDAKIQVDSFESGTK